MIGTQAEHIRAELQKKTRCLSKVDLQTLEELASRRDLDIDGSLRVLDSHERDVIRLMRELKDAGAAIATADF